MGIGTGPLLGLRPANDAAQPAILSPLLGTDYGGLR